MLRRRDEIVLGFAGITPKLQFCIGTRGAAGIMVLHEGIVWDILVDFDVIEQRTADGRYRCRLCEPADLFPSREALWTSHCLEPMLAWTNEHFDASRSLLLFGQEGHTTYAQIRQTPDVAVGGPKAGAVYYCPLVQQAGTT